MVAHSVYPEDDDIPRHVEYARRLPDWMRDAACADHDPSDWFPERRTKQPAQHGTSSSDRSTIPGDECLSWALRERMNDGIWAGTTPGERRRLRARRRT
jgi:WhiB family transcriptional regulator, redox-sensing transcriptional regulator